MDQPLLFLLAAAVGGLAVGLGAGFYLGRSTGADAQRNRELQSTLDAGNREFAAFRKEVSRHFTRTTALATELAARHRSLHDHLAQGAHALAGQVLEGAETLPTAPRAPGTTTSPRPALVERASVQEPPSHPAMTAPSDYPQSQRG